MLDLLGEFLPVVAQTTTIYIFLVAALRLMGRRQTSELSTVELTVVMIIGSSVETALIAGDSTLLAGLVSATTLFACDRLFSAMQERWEPLGRLMIGRPIPLVYKGQFLTRRMEQAGLTKDDVLAGIRNLGYDDIESVKLAMLEIHGRISVLPLDKDGKGDKASD